ncbi:MAG: Fe-S protein assembly co-chaperone HscB [Burkholderiaceae bacterium]
MTGKLSASHFEFFALPETFELDLEALEAAYRRVQASVHPDRFANAPQAQRRYAMQLASRANEAVRVLREPLSRARYLCELHGVEVGAESNTVMAPEFLELQMSWREALEDARTQCDAAAIDGLEGNLAAERGALQRSVAESLAGADHRAAGEAVRRWMFVERFDEELRRVRKQIERNA